MFTNTLVGATVTAAIALATGTIGAMVMSIYCTMGLALAVWIPVWAAVGWFVTGVLARFGANREEASGWTRHRRCSDEAHEGDRRPAVDIETVRARRYVHFARNQGRSDEEIRQSLLRSCWKPAEVDALLALEPDGQSNRP